MCWLEGAPVLGICHRWQRVWGDAGRTRCCHVRALYGLKSAGASWNHHLAREVSAGMGFSPPCKAEDADGFGYGST
jgi:hypothetical protein